MLKYVVGGAVLVAILGAAYYFLVVQAPIAQQPNTNNPGSTMGVATSTYATSTYSIVYPASYTKDEAYAYDKFGPTKLIHGVKFVIPESMATGTTLSANTYIAVEQLPRAKKCTADIYIKEDVRAYAFTENGVAYSVATTSGAAAGNMYEEMVYALSGSSPCTAIRYFIHSSNIGNYAPGAVQEFNRAQLLSDFDTIRRSLQVSQLSQPLAPTTEQP